MATGKLSWNEARAMGRERYHEKHLVDPAGDGCDVAPHCVDCPLSVCKYDDVRPYHRWKVEKAAK